MVAFLKKLTAYCIGIIVIAGVTLYALNKTSNANNSQSETYSITRGNVTKIASVSGKVEAIHEAELGFPTPGTLKEIFKKEGDTVLSGEIIASLDSGVLAAEYNAALYDLEYQNSLKRELLKGPQHEARAVTDTKVAIAQKNLERVTQEQDLLVQAARETLMSSDLEALPVSKLNNDTPPVVSGNYHCDTGGTYTLSIYKSSSPTGYTYMMSGLETGTLPTYADTPSPLGSCGLYIQFDPAEWYRNEDWNIEIPNTRGPSYISNVNAYDLAVKTRDHAIELATQELELAEKNATFANALPTLEKTEQADTRIAQASALLDAKEALLADRVVRAPFDGVITDINMKVGEVVDTTKTITLIRDGSYILKARIPEVDIRNIQKGNSVTVTFDAAPQEPLTGLIDFISPSSVEIDGVSYYEAHIRLSHEPSWLREGLNADIDITTTQKNNVLIIPKRFTLYENNEYYALVKENDQIYKRHIETGLLGDDGNIEVLNLEEGITIVMPT